MSRAVALLLAFVLCGCAAPERTSAKLTRGVRLSAYKRIGVMPFAGRGSQGEAIAEELSKRLFQLRYSVVYGRQLRAALSQLGVRKGDEIGAQTLRELRRLTRIEALLVGSIDCGVRSRKPRASALLVDPADNRILLKMRFKPKSCGDPDSPRVIAEAIASEMRRTLAKEGRSGFDSGFGP
jgi:hypothetical protein